MFESAREANQKFRYLVPLMVGGAVPILSLASAQGIYVWLSCGLGWCLLALAAIDRSHYILPDRGTLGLLATGLAYGLFLSPTPWYQHMVGATVGGLSLLVLKVLYQALRKREGLGWGDVKLLAAAGAWLGVEAIPSVITEASICALIVVYLQAAARKRRLELVQSVAFGPYLCGAFYLTWLFGPLEFA